MHSVFTRPTRDPRRRSRGQSLAEFALVAPVLLLILLFAIDFGRALYGWVILQNSTRIAANFAALNPDGWQGSGNAAIQAEYESLLENDLNTANCQAPSTPPAPVFTDGPDTAVTGGNPDTAFDFGDTVVVGLSCTFQPVTPIIGSVVGANLQLSASAEFRIRAGELTGLPNPTRIPPPPTPTPTPTGTTPTPTPTAAACAAPRASFTGSPTSGPGGTLSVQFTSTSTSSPGCTLTYSWDFGDGQTSTSESPLHLYTKTNQGQQQRFTVRLTVTVQASGLSDTATANNYITVNR